MLRVENIGYEIGKTTLLKAVSLALEPGKLHLIIGPNGAGKSTLIKVITHQVKAKTGTIYYHNKDVKQFTSQDLAKIRSVLSQNIDLAFPLSVREVVMMGRYPHFTGMPEQKDLKAVEEAMLFFDVSHMQERNYLTLSGGEKQRVQFARVLAQIWYPVPGEGRYLFLDEPLTFLDIRYQFDFMHKMKELLKSGDLTIIGVVHDLNLAAKFADHLMLMKDGKIIATGNRQEVLTKEHLFSAYHLSPIVHYENGEMYLFFQ
jgi:iron complex transport system ATP-binding protein